MLYQSGAIVERICALEEGGNSCAGVWAHQLGVIHGKLLPVTQFRDECYKVIVAVVVAVARDINFSDS